MTEVRLLGYIAELLGYRRKQLQLEEPTELGDILKFPENVDPERIIILVNGKPATLKHAVEDGDYVVVVMPVIGGG